MNRMTGNDRDVLAGRLREDLEMRSEISFAYLHGSFRTGRDFRDIDVAVFLKNEAACPLLQYELAVEAGLMEVSGGLPVDVRVLNASPLSFRYRVIREGMLLFSRNDDERSDFHEATLSAYFDFAPYRRRYLKETLGSGI